MKLIEILNQIRRLKLFALNKWQRNTVTNFNFLRRDRYKNKHQGEIGFLVGSGPSVRIEDLEKLRDRVTFCCNRFYLAYDKMKFRPKYTFSTDPQMIEDFGTEIVTKSKNTVFLVSKNPPNLPGKFIWLPMKNKSKIVFSENIYDHVMPGGATLIAAIQVGYFMGIKHFVMYGVDHSFKFIEVENKKDIARRASGEGNHFIDNYRSGKLWCQPQMKQIELSFQVCDEFLRSRGGWVKNATRGGKLDVVERVDFDTVMNELEIK